MKKAYHHEENYSGQVKKEEIIERVLKIYKI